MRRTTTTPEIFRQSRTNLIMCNPDEHVTKLLQCTTTPWHIKFKFTLRAIHNSKFHVVIFEDYKKYYRLTIPGIINLIQSDAMPGGNVSAAPCRIQGPSPCCASRSTKSTCIYWKLPPNYLLTVVSPCSNMNTTWCAIWTRKVHILLQGVIF